MDPEKFSKEKIDKVTPEQKEIRENVVESVTAKIDEIDSLSENLVVDAQKKIDKAKADMKLPDELIDSIWSSLGIDENQKDISREAEIFADNAKDKMYDIILDLPEIDDGHDSSQSNEGFDPKNELLKIRRAPRAERKKLLHEFKEKLAYQKEGLASLQADIIGTIKQRPDTPISELYESIVEQGAKYGINHEQKKLAMDLLQAYEKKHMAIRKYRQKYPEDEGLFKAVFGKEPNGSINVIDGPVTFYFQCDDPADYAFIYSGAFMQNRSVNEEEIKRANMSGGVSISASLISELRGSIIAENSSRIKSGDHQKVLDHEEQHVIKKIFGEIISQRDASERLNLAESDQERLLAVRDCLRLNREYWADEKARDEILAYFIGENIESYMVVQTLTKSKEEGGLYDYLNESKVWGKKIVTEKMQAKSMFIHKFGPEFEAIADEEIQRVYVDEYKELISNSVGILDYLLSAGLSKEQIVAIFIHEPLSKWNKVKARLMEQKFHIDVD